MPELADHTALLSDIAAQPQTQKTGSAQKRCVLLADDDPDFLFQHSTILESMGFTVISAESRSEAVDKLDEQELTLAVVDLMMEESDSGFALCHEIKQRYPRTPIIIVTSAGALTGYDFESLSGDQRKWIQADAVLAKPIRFDQLAAETSRLLDR